MENINNFFYPGSICIVGASTKPKSIGYELLNTIITYDYRGKIYPVNPKADEVFGYRCYKTIEEIEENIDLAIIVVPKQFVEDSIDSLLEKGVKSIILITAGFRETGSEGETVEKRITGKVKKNGARLVGPNCMGIINTLDRIKLNATFVAEKPETGSTGFLSQSGALGAAVLNSLRETDIRFAHFISVGNKADINENDILHYWQKDDNIKTITMYLESFVSGKDLLEPVIKREITKPVIVLKAGKTESGMKAASSHTGAMSSSDKIVDALLKQFGIIRVEDINELFNTAKGFENFPLPEGNRIAVVTNAGGPAILTVDSLEKEGLSLASFSGETKSKLMGIVNPAGSINNPVDLLPGGNAGTYKKVTEIISADKNVDAVISIFVQPVMVDPLPVIESVSEIKSDKPVLQVVMPLPEFWQEYRSKSVKHIPLFRNPEDPSKIISNMLFYSLKKKELAGKKNEYLSLLNKKSKANIPAGTGFISQEEVNKLCGEYNIPAVKSKLLKPDELDEIPDDYFPVVLKGINENVVHKSELDAVKLNIKNKNELLKKADEIIKSFAGNKYEVEQFLIQPFIKTKFELLLGGFRDPSFGPVIMFGTGGKYVEVINDTAIRSAYLSDDDITGMIEETGIGKILKGVRGEKSVDLDKLKKVIYNSALMLIENKSITEFDFNPLIITGDNSLYAVDIRVKAE